MEDTKEIWTDVLGFESHFQVSNLGRIRSKDRLVVFKNGCSRFYNGIIRKQHYNKKRGYMYISFKVKGIVKTMSVHRVVAESFLGIKDGLCVDHVDSNKLNNKLDNLRWITNRENLTRALCKDGSPGVCWHKVNKKYISSIYNNGKINHLGYYTSKKEAEIAYKKALSNV